MSTQSTQILNILIFCKAMVYFKLWAMLWLIVASSLSTLCSAYQHVCSFKSGLPSWGIAWYIDDTLIPELHLQRGVNYTFKVSGGKDHPFYITDSIVGGYSQVGNAIWSSDLFAIWHPNLVISINNELIEKLCLIFSSLMEKQCILEDLGVTDPKDSQVCVSKYVVMGCRLL